MTTRGVFPQREVMGVSFEVTAQRGGFDAVRVAGVALGIDEFVISSPVGPGFGFEPRCEHHDASMPLPEMAEDGFRIAGKQ